MDDLVKVFFQLQPDEDGWPPISVESVWAKASDCENEYVIDNVPFFAHDATIGDTVQVRKEDGIRCFEKVVKRSGNSLIRIIVDDLISIEEVKNRLAALGCDMELAEPHRLLAVSIPPSVKLSDVQEYLRTQARAGVLDFEEPILMQ